MKNFDGEAFKAEAINSADKCSRLNEITSILKYSGMTFETDGGRAPWSREMTVF